MSIQVKSKIVHDRTDIADMKGSTLNAEFFAALVLRECIF